MGIYLGSTNVGGGGVQPTGSVTTNFTIGQDVMDEITSPMNGIFHGNILTDTGIYKIGCVGMRNSSGVFGITTMQNGTLNTVISPVTIGGNTYYGKQQYSGENVIALGFRATTASIDYYGGTAKIIVASSEQIVTREYTLNSGSIAGTSAYPVLALNVPLSNGETLLYLDFVSNNS